MAVTHPSTDTTRFDSWNAHQLITHAQVAKRSKAPVCKTGELSTWVRIPPCAPASFKMSVMTTLFRTYWTDAANQPHAQDCASLTEALALTESKRK